MADAIINDDSDEEEEIRKMFLWETMDNYSGHEELFSDNIGPINEAENICNMLECFELFFDKDLIQHIMMETNICRTI